MAITGSFSHKKYSWKIFKCCHIKSSDTLSHSGKSIEECILHALNQVLYRSILCRANRFCVVVHDQITFINIAWNWKMDGNTDDII